jgi:hypothetical protein
MSVINVTVGTVTGASVTAVSGDSVNVSVGDTTANNAVNVSVGTAFSAGSPEFQLQAGANITISTAQGTYTVIGRDVPVQSVNGKTGTIALTSVDVSAASAVHSHVAAEITNLTSVANVVSVNGKTGSVSLVAADLTAAESSHAHPYVTSLNGQTGTLSLVAGANVTVTTGVGTLTVASGGGGGLGENDEIDGGDYTGATP